MHVPFVDDLGTGQFGRWTKGAVATAVDVVGVVNAALYGDGGVKGDGAWRRRPRGGCLGRGTLCLFFRLCGFTLDKS